jgi:hypothetical protein
MPNGNANFKYLEHGSAARLSSGAGRPRPPGPPPCPSAPPVGRPLPVLGAPCLFSSGWRERGSQSGATPDVE